MAKTPVTSIKGLKVDFDLMEIKAKLEIKPSDIIKERQELIKLRNRRKKNSNNKDSKSLATNLVNIRPVAPIEEIQEESEVLEEAPSETPERTRKIAK